MFLSALQCHSSNVRRRLEDRIQKLCERIVASKSEEEIKSSCSELRGALSEYAERLREKLKAYPVTSERRSNIANSSLAP